MDYFYGKIQFVLCETPQFRLTVKEGDKFLAIIFTDTKKVKVCKDINTIPTLGYKYKTGNTFSGC
jgi:hypothetical protein